MEGLVISDAVKDLIINIINIIILFVIVRALAYNPVKKFLDARKNKIEELKNSAEQAENKAKENLEKYESLLSDAKLKGEEIIGNAEREARKNAENILEDARLKAEMITEKAHTAAEDERKSIIASAKEDIISSAFEISKRILNREISDEDNRKIAENFFSESKG